jgi:hypothetical protein
LNLLQNFYRKELRLAMSIKPSVVDLMQYRRKNASVDCEIAA